MNMQVAGKLIIGQSSNRRQDGEIFAVAAESGSRLEPSFGGASMVDLEKALHLAWQAFPIYRETSPKVRAAFLRMIADEIEAIGDALIVRAMLESGLTRPRLEGVRMRMINQLTMFAAEIETGNYLDLRIDPADPERKPAPRPELRSRRVALGPVAVFGASNFPLAFSVAGGDTASALAAGCPVVIEAHSAHLGTCSTPSLPTRTVLPHG